MADGVIFGGGRDALSTVNAFRRENGLPELSAEAYNDIIMASLALVDGTGEADVRRLRVGGFDVAKVELPTRAAFEAATIPDWVKEWSFYSHPVPSSYTMKLEFVRDDNGIACESANGVKGSPAGEPTAFHYGILPGAVVPAGLIEAATADCDARGWQLYFPGSPEKYDLDTHHIYHCNIKGDGSSGERSDGHQTVFRSVGLGTAVRWHDYGRAGGAGDVVRTMLVFGRSELTIRDVRFENAANWEHYVLAPGTRKCWAENVSGTGATDVGVLFDNSWSDRHTVLMALHPTIRPGAGCNECGVRNPDLQSATFGWGIVGTERNPDNYTSEQWIWGYGGASDFRAEGGRGDGFVLDAACKNAAWMIQSITVDGYAPRIGSNPVMFRIFRASDVILNNFYGEATAVQDNPTPARIEVSSETAARGNGKIIVNHCDVIRASVWMDGVNTNQTLAAGGGGLPFWDITTKSGTRFVYGKVVNEEGVTGTVGLGYTPFGIRPLFNLLGSLGTSTREWLTVRVQRLRTNSPRLWIRTKQDGVTDPGLFISIGNSLIKALFEKNRILLWVPGIPRPYSLDDDEVPVDPETATDGLVLSPNNIRPNTANGAGLGATSYPWSALRSSTVYTNAVVFGATTSGTVRILSGSTSPEGNVAAPVGTLYLQDTADGAFSTTWRKATGTGNTGWVRGQADLVRGRTRAGFVAEVAAGFAPLADTVIFAGGDAYRRVIGANEIADLPGWLPDGDATPDHWGIAAGTDETAKIAAMIDWASASKRKVVWGEGPYLFDGHEIYDDQICIYWRSSSPNGTVLRSTRTGYTGSGFDDNNFLLFRGNSIASAQLAAGLSQGQTILTLPADVVDQIVEGETQINVFTTRVIETDDRGQARCGYDAIVSRIVSATEVEVDMPSPIDAQGDGASASYTITSVTGNVVRVAALAGEAVSDVRYQMVFTTVNGAASAVTMYPSEFDPATGDITFVTSVPAGLTAGDTLYINRVVSAYLYRGVHVDMEGITLDRPPMFNAATTGEWGHRGLGIFNALRARLVNVHTSGFANTGIRLNGCHRAYVSRSDHRYCNRSFDGGEGTGYGVSVEQSSLGKFEAITGYGCRRALDFGGTQRQSWSNRARGVINHGGGKTFNGGDFWPVGLNRNSVAGSHGAACNTLYDDLSGVDVWSIAQIRGKDERYRGLHGYGRISRAATSFWSADVDIDDVTYSDGRPQWYPVDDVDTYAKGTNTGWLDSVLAITEQSQRQMRVRLSNIKAHGIGNQLILFEGPVTLGSLVIGGVNDISLSEKVSGDFRVFNRTGAASTLDGKADFGWLNVQQRPDADFRAIFRNVNTFFVMTPNAIMRLPNGRVIVYIPKDGVVALPVQSRETCDVSLRVFSQSSQVYCSGINISRLGLTGPAGRGSRNLVSVRTDVLTGATGAVGDISLSFDPNGGRNKLFIENRTTDPAYVEVYASEMLP